MSEIVSRILYAVAMLCISGALVNHTNRLKSLDFKCDGVMANVHALRGRTKMHEHRLDDIEERLRKLEGENIEQWDFVMALSNDVARHNLIEKEKQNDTD